MTLAANPDPGAARVQLRYGLLHIAWPVASLCIGVVGIAQGMAWLARLGLVAFGAALAVIGTLAIVERRVLFWNETVSNRVAIQTHRGVPAVLMGAAVLLGGVIVLLLVTAHALGASVQAMRGLVLTRPGLALVPVGTMLVLFGLSFVAGLLAGRDADKGLLFNAMLGLPSRVGGAILLAWGLAALGAGTFELLQPEAFDRAVRRMFGA